MMRTKSAYLMTSWGVVGTWVTVTLLTGLVSMLSVTQPTWYIRYTTVHAQAIQGVSFQVVVSSVGPLGFCRLVSVEEHPVTEPYIPRASEDESGPPTLEYDPGTTEPVSTESFKVKDEPETTTEPTVDESLQSIGLLVTTESLMVTSNAEEYHHSDGKYEIPTESIAEVVAGGNPLDTVHESLLEWPVPTPTTVGFQEVPSSSTAFPESYGRGNKNKKVFEPEVLPSETYTTAVEEFVTRRSIANEEDILGATGGYVNVIHKDKEKALDMALAAGEGGFIQGGEEMDVTESETSIRANASLTRGGLDTADGTDILVDGGGNYIRGNATNNMRESNYSRENANSKIKEPTLRRQEYEENTITQNKKSKKKRKKKRKKNRKNKKRKKNRSPYYKKSDVNVAPSEIKEQMKYFPHRPKDDLNNDTFLIENLNSEFDVEFRQDNPAAELLIQQENIRRVERSSYSSYYKPRRPILGCSGVTAGLRAGSSSVWVLVGVLYGIAGTVQVMMALTSVVSQAVRSPNERFAYALWIGNIQVAVVMSQGVALVLFPLGLGSPLARLECGGSSSVYWSGDCTFGWGYMLAIVTTTLAAYCPCLARLTVYKKYALREWDSLNFF